MKNHKFILVIVLAFGLTSVSKAQYCNYSGMSEGRVLGYQNLNAKGKVTVKSRMTCLDVSTDDMGGTIYKIKTELIKADDTPLASREYNTKCKDGKFSVDLTGFDNPDALKQFRNLKIDIYTYDAVYPEALSVGQSLPNLISVISIPQKGTTVLLKTNWKVESNESVTVPAGTFDCFKITYDLEIKSSSNNKFKVSEYVAVGVGNIKSETFNTKGKLKSSSVLYELVK